MPSNSIWRAFEIILARSNLRAKRSLLDLCFTLKEFNWNALSADLTFSIHVDKLLILILKSPIKLNFEAKVSSWVALADYKVRDGNFTRRISRSLQLLAWFDRNFVYLRLIKVD